jgi:N-acetylmuramoyl-L-alanine amidase
MIKKSPVWLTIFFFFLSSQIFCLTLDETISALAETTGAAGKKAEFRWDPFFQSGVFSLADHYAAFSAASGAGETGFLLLDGRELYTVSLPYPDSGELVFPEVFTASLKHAFSRAIEEDAGRFRIAAIIIDPGHGGKDPGAISEGNFMIRGKSQKAVEKGITLDVSQRLKGVLARAYPDKRILMTRDRDTFPSLAERTTIANSVPLKDNEAIVYISIHANKAIRNANTRGYEVWYLPSDFRRNLLAPAKYPDSADLLPILNDMLQEEFTTESILMGKAILRAFGEILGPSVPSRGLKAKDWYVVRNSRMPAVLVELGFLDNKDDVLLMTSESGLQKLTEALYKGMAEFIGAFERSGGFTAVR